MTIPGLDQLPSTVTTHTLNSSAATPENLLIALGGFVIVIGFFLYGRKLKKDKLKKTESLK